MARLTEPVRNAELAARTIAAADVAEMERGQICWSTAQHVAAAIAKKLPRPARMRMVVPYRALNGASPIARNAHAPAMQESTAAVTAQPLMWPPDALM